MCSHDGCMFNAQNERYYLQLNDEDRFISFLPLNHIAAQYVDTMIPVANRVTMYLARPDALRGTLVATLRKARPTFFVAVPRVYEKFQMAIRAKNRCRSSVWTAERARRSISSSIYSRGSSTSV